MSNYKERLKIEKSELLSRIERLEEFINSEKFKSIDEVQKTLLNIQLKSMDTYHECLHHRLSNL